MFRSDNDGQTWTPMTDGMPALSTGDLRLAPDGALWFATGEANTGATAFLGTGVYRLATPSSGVVLARDRVGGTELESTFIGKLRFDGIGNVYAATSRGVWKHSASTNAGAWQRVLYPVPDPVVNGVPRPDLQSPTTTSATTSQSSRAAAGSMCSSTARGAAARRTTASTTPSMAGRPSRGSIRPAR